GAERAGLRGHDRPGVRERGGGGQDLLRAVERTGGGAGRDARGGGTPPAPIPAERRPAIAPGSRVDTADGRFRRLLPERFDEAGRNRHGASPAGVGAM